MTADCSWQKRDFKYWMSTWVSSYIWYRNFCTRAKCLVPDGDNSWRLLIVTNWQLLTMDLASPVPSSVHHPAVGQPSQSDWHIMLCGIEFLFLSRPMSEVNWQQLWGLGIHIHDRWRMYSGGTRKYFQWVSAKWNVIWCLSGGSWLWIKFIRGSKQLYIVGSGHKWLNLKISISGFLHICYPTCWPKIRAGILVLRKITMGHLNFESKLSCIRLSRKLADIELSHLSPEPPIWILYEF